MDAAHVTSFDPVPRLYALRREEDGEEPAAVLAWGLAFADGRAVTLWLEPYPGAKVGSGSLEAVEELHAPLAGAYVVWADGTSPEEG